MSNTIDNNHLSQELPESATHTDDASHILALGAHQMCSPVAVARSLIRTILGGYAGDLNDQQRRLLNSADARCQQAQEAIGRILTIANILRGRLGDSQTVDIGILVRQLATSAADDARTRGIVLETDIPAGKASVHGSNPAIKEAIRAVLDNAIKYTPDRGSIRVRLECPVDRPVCQVVVSDSGIGIPEALRDEVFLPFIRGAAAAAGSSRPGTGLGLSLVQHVAEAIGGQAFCRDSSLGGAEIVVEFPLTRKTLSLDPKGENMQSRSLQVIVIGGVAAGPKVASKILRICPTAEVTIVEKGKLLSYAGCGLPYYVSGEVRSQEELMATPVGVLRDPVFFQNVKNVKVLNETEAIGINRENRQVRVRDLINGEESTLGYDKLVLATGATPVTPPIPGYDLGNIYTLHGVSDAEGIRQALSVGKAKDVVVVGGGLIGVEITEALVRRGCRVTIVEKLPQVLPVLDTHMARLVEQHMESRGVRVLTGAAVKEFLGDGSVSEVVTSAGRMPADLVVLAIGVRPNVELAEMAGLDIGPTGAIAVNDYMETSDPDIYAAGDCVQCTDILTGKPCFVPLGSTANKQGRVAAINVCGGHDVFPGVLGSTVCKIFDFCVARTGLSEIGARECGFDPCISLAPAPDKAHFMPDAKPLLLKLVADRKSRRLLGAQAVGAGAGDKRIDVAAMAITAGMTVDQLANADLCYAPPFSPAMDNILTAANVLRNKLDGYMKGISAAQVHEMIEQEDDFMFLDVRSPAEYERVRLPNTTLIPLGALRGRLEELPRDRTIVTFCKISLRGYEAALILKAAGFEDVKVMDGGIAMWPYEKLT